MSAIYVITNLINQKQYVGKTSYSIEKRWKEHCYDSKKNDVNKHRPLYNAIQKYGVENFSISLLEDNIQDNEINEREKFWISKLNTYYQGYNATLGGDGKILYDYTLFIEDYNSGMLVNEIANKYGCDRHTVTKALQINNVDGKINSINRLKHKVYQYDKENNFIQSFDSQRDAARYLIENGHKGSITSIATNIGRVVKGQRKSAEGYIWKTE